MAMTASFGLELCIAALRAARVGRGSKRLTSQKLSDLHVKGGFVVMRGVQRFKLSAALNSSIFHWV